MSDKSRPPDPSNPSAKPALSPAEKREAHASTVAWSRATAGVNSSGDAGGEPPTIEAIGKYRVVGALDAGGQGQVYRAVHPQLQKELVVKLGRRCVAGDGEKDRLVAEGRILAELDHPNLARVYDLDFHEGRPYLVMEYIRGRTLRQFHQGGDVTWREAARIVSQVARALSIAHARGVLHLDVKPDNIIIDERSVARLIDFGMARFKHAWGEDAPTSGSVSGTIPYMAPEQARGETNSLDQRTDVFALGAVLYWLLTGRAPFASDDFGAALDAAQRCDFDRAALTKADGPQAIKDTCFKALGEQREERHASTAALADELERDAAPRSGNRTLASMSVGSLGCAVTVSACSLFLAVGFYVWYGREAGTTKRDEVAVVDPDSESKDVTTRALDAPSSPPPRGRSVETGDLAAIEVPDEAAAPALPYRGPVRSDLGRLNVFVRDSLGEPSVGLESIRKPLDVENVHLRFEVDLPDAIVPALFWYDGGGKLRCFEMTLERSQRGPARWSWPRAGQDFAPNQDEATDDASGTSPSFGGTNVVVVCATGVDPPILDSANDLFDETKPWPTPGGDWIATFDRNEVVFLSGSSFASDIDDAEAETRRAALRDRANELRKELAKRFDFVSGVVFPLVADSSSN